LSFQVEKAEKEGRLLNVVTSEEGWVDNPQVMALMRQAQQQQQQQQQHKTSSLRHRSTHA
jgi:hypothetical protein